MNVNEVYAKIEMLYDTVLFGVEIETGIDYTEHMMEYEYEEYVDEYTGEVYSEEISDYSSFAYDIAYVLHIDVEDIYDDGSCGAEIPSSTYNDPCKFRYDLKRLKQTFKEYEFDYMECLSPTYGAGGHFNLSFDGFDDDISYLNTQIRPFVPLLEYMFAHPYTDSRKARFRFMRNDWKCDSSEVDEKYHWLHEKNYALEFRFPDSPALINYSTVQYYTIIGLAITASLHKPSDASYTMRNNIIFDEDIYDIYYKIIDSDYPLSQHEKQFLYNMFQAMLEYLDEYMQFLYDKYGIDLKGVLMYCFEHPAVFNNECDISDDVFEYFIPSF